MYGVECPKGGFASLAIFLEVELEGVNDVLASFPVRILMAIKLR
jgi:hypothetical protein